MLFMNCWALPDVSRFGSAGFRVATLEPNRRSSGSYVHYDFDYYYLSRAQKGKYALPFIAAHTSRPNTYVASFNLMKHFKKQLDKNNEDANPVKVMWMINTYSSIENFCNGFNVPVSLLAYNPVLCSFDFHMVRTIDNRLIMSRKTPKKDKNGKIRFYKNNSQGYWGNNDIPFAIRASGGSSEIIEIHPSYFKDVTVDNSPVRCVSMMVAQHKMIDFMNTYTLDNATNISNLESIVSDDILSLTQNNIELRICYAENRSAVQLINHDTGHSIFLGIPNCKRNSSIQEKIVYDYFKKMIGEKTI